MLYLCLFNPETRVIELPREISETALLTEEVCDHPRKDELLAPWLKALYEREAFCRGCPWCSYFSDKEAFSWAAYDKAVADAKKAAPKAQKESEQNAASAAKE